MFLDELQLGFGVEFQKISLSHLTTLATGRGLGGFFQNLGFYIFFILFQKRLLCGKDLISPFAIAVAASVASDSG